MNLTNRKFHPKYKATVNLIGTATSILLCSCNGTGSTANNEYSTSTVSPQPTIVNNIKAQPLTETHKYKIFVATNDGNGFKGNLTKYSSESGSTAAADEICNTSSDKPDDTVTYRAILGSSNRYACNESGDCGVTNSFDWVLAGNTTYYNTDESMIFTTNESGIFNFADYKLTGPFANESGSNTWTGLTDDWRKNNHTCNDWTSDNGSNTGRAGKTNSIESYSISYTQSNCDNKHYIYCVEQISTIDPVNGAKNIPPDTLITVTYSQPVNPLSVTTDTFTVTSKNGILINGSISTSSDNKTFTFKPSKFLNYNTSYYVNLKNIRYSDGELAKDLSSYFTIVSKSELMIFVTNNSYNGGFIGTSTAADARCMKEVRDGQVDLGTHSHGIYKAMLAYSYDPETPDNLTRYACTNNGCGGINSSNWVLQPEQRYISNIKTSDGNYIFIGNTTASAIFPEILEGPIGQDTNRIWTGLKTDWTSSDSNCNNWASNTKQGKTGSIGSTSKHGGIVTADILHIDQLSCMDEISKHGIAYNKAHLYCIEQPYTN